MSMLEIRVPAEQEGTRSQVLRWLKRPGEPVRLHEPLVELETDKVTVEVPAPADGVLAEIAKAEGEELQPGEVLGRIRIGGAAKEVNEVPEAASDATAVKKGVPVVPNDAGLPQTAGVSGPGAPRQLSPAVKRLLAERSLDPAHVRGTGQGGRITVEDVLAHTGENVLARTGSAAPKPAASAKADTLSPGRMIPHTPARQRIAEHMVQSLLHTAPHVTSVFDADMSAVVAHRAAHRAEFEKRGTPLTFTAYFVAAAVAGIRAVPEANSRWTNSALEVYDHVDMGIATALEEGGLVVPVLRNAHALDLFAIAAGLHDLVTRARSGGLRPSDMRGGTFTISNHGVSGSVLATPIVINQPQSAILGVGKLEQRPVVLDGDRIVPRPRCYVTLTIDHRVMDGLQANRFLQAFVAALQAPAI
jgi:2-oxoglutarate dehydrogenase E2 component (dihydrolipoamide succinyltransferase)